MTTKLAHLVALTAAFGLTACPADDDGDTTNASNVTTASTSVSTTEPAESSGGMEESSGTASTTVGTTEPMEESSTAPSDSSSGGDECLPTDECREDGDCAGGGMCISCLCVGGEETGTGECGTNISTQNAACDECIFTNCCAEAQACWGDETVTEPTECVELNNCIGMNNCMDQACIEENCSEFAGSIEPFLALNMCIGTSCASDCG